MRRWGVGRLVRSREVCVFCVGELWVGRKPLSVVRLGSRIELVIADLEISIT